MVSAVITLTFQSGYYTYDVYHLVKAFLPGAKIEQRVDSEVLVCVGIEMEKGHSLFVLPEDLLQYPDKKDRKHFVNLKVYRWLEKVTGKELAWGILTGIRPTKIAMLKLEQGESDTAIVHHFMEEALVSEAKAKLGLEIAKREKVLLEQLDYDNGYSLYVGIPFCPTTCSYCSFTSYPIRAWKNRVDEYLDALCKEITFVGQASKEKKLNTIYVGGGTPTTLEPAQLDRLLAHLEQTFSYEELKEITVEAGRPDSITAEKLDVLRAHHISRISINPQTMQQETLDIIGRLHTVEDIRRVYHMARDKGFDNINMDLIAGLPGESAEDMQDTLEQIQRLAPDSVTVHALALKRGSRLIREKLEQAQEHKADAEDENTETQMAETLSGMIEMAAEYASAMGLYPYYMYRQKNIAGNFENVGYAKADKAGIYNILIMEEKQTIIAVGAGASTKLVMQNNGEYLKENQKRIERVENVKDIDLYISRIDEMIERKGEALWR